MKQRMGLALALLSPTGADGSGRAHQRPGHRGHRGDPGDHHPPGPGKRGSPFLVASHLASEIEKMCHKVLVLHEGEMLSFDTKEEALRLHPSLEDYFLAKVRDKKGSVIL